MAELQARRGWTRLACDRSLEFLQPFDLGRQFGRQRSLSNSETRFRRRSVELRRTRMSLFERIVDRAEDHALVMGHIGCHRRESLPASLAPE